MKHYTNPRFWRCYQGLPQEVRELADRNYALLKSSPTHRSLHFKKIGPLWSVRVGLHFRALATEAGDDLVWFWIGSHADYDVLVGRKGSTKPLLARGRVRKKVGSRRRQ